jgi:DNA-binding MarR family transcriptional regulator
MRKRPDQLYIRTLGPREVKALRVIEQRPGVTVGELAEAMGVTMTRAWQYVGRLEASRVRREQAS